MSLAHRVFLLHILILYLVGKFFLDSADLGDFVFGPFLKNNHGVGYGETQAETSTSESATSVAPSPLWPGSGKALLPPARLKTIYFQLSRHHSKDPHFLRHILAAMAQTTAASSTGWMCGNCRLLRSYQATYCDLCGGHWQQCMVTQKTQTRSSSRRRPPYAADPDTQTPWSTHAWGNPNRPKSPRQNPRQKAPKKNKGKNKGQGKGQGKESNSTGSQQLLAPPPPPPLNGEDGLQRPPWMSMTLPPGSASSQTLNPAEQKLKELSAMPKKANQDTLPPELQHFVAEETKAETKGETKALHSAVAVLGRARDQLDAALLSRSNLMTQWRAFLSTSLERFRQYTDHFQCQEQAHQENIAKAKEALIKAKQEYQATEEKATTISDEEPEMKDAPAKDTATCIREGLHTMTEGLKTLAEEAEKAAISEERKTKRPRAAPADEQAADVPIGTMPSMQPFGGPGQT